MKRLFSIGAVLLLLCSCASLTLHDKPAAGQYRDVEPRLDGVNYEGECRVQLKSSALNQSGRCQVVLTASGQFRLSILHPVFGGTLLQSYLTAERVQLLDSVNKNFFQGENTSQNRQRVLGGFDLSLMDLRRIFLGRSQGGDDNFRFQYQGAIPRQALRGALQVTYRKWTEVQGIPLPGMLILQNYRTGSQLKIVFTQISLNPGPEKPYDLLNGYQIQF